METLYETIFYSAKVNVLFTNEATIGYMLRFEAALAKAQAKHGIIPAQAAVVIETYCKVENLDIRQITEEAALGGNINIPLIKQLITVIKKDNEEAAKYVHYGATSQDVIDTALMLRLKEATNIIAAGLDKLIEQIIMLTREHRDTVMIGRSFMQQAKPITFGFKTAGWLDALLRSKQSIQYLLKENFALQLGGAAGTLAAMDKKGLEISATMSEELGLYLPAKPWHTQRDRIAIIATTFGILAGNAGKIAKDISLMMQTEIAEVNEPSKDEKGGSSTMPHKRNPVGCISILANTARMPGLIATILSCMNQDHERATGLWHAEWQTLTDIVQLTAGSVIKAIEITDSLEVNKEKMLANLEITKGLIYAENISLALTPFIGKTQAHALIEQCSKEAQLKNIHLKDACINQPLVSQHLKPSALEKLFDPSLSTGMCDVFIERVLNNAHTG